MRVELLAVCIRYGGAALRTLRAYILSWLSPAGVLTLHAHMRRTHVCASVRFNLKTYLRYEIREILTIGCPASELFRPHSPSHRFGPRFGG